MTADNELWQNRTQSAGRPSTFPYRALSFLVQEQQRQSTVRWRIESQAGNHEGSRRYWEGRSSFGGVAEQIPRCRKEEAVEYVCNDSMHHITNPNVCSSILFSTVFVPDRYKLPPLKGEKRYKNKTAAMLKSHGVSLFSKNATTRSMPASPSLGASKSPLSGSAGVTATPALLDEKSRKLQSLRTPLLHLLAVRPVSVKFLCQTLKCTSNECSQVLEKFGRTARLDPSKWDLSDRGFKELDIWHFNYPTQDDRQAAIERAVSAYDRMRLSREEKIWQMLLPKHERGKGKILSKLHLHNGPMQRMSTPRINVQPTSEANGGSNTSGNDGDNRKDRLAPSDGEPTARSRSQDSIKKKRVSEKEAQSRRLLSKNPKKSIAAVKARDTKAKETKLVAKKVAVAADDKIKSAEFVNDSDKDVEMEDSIIVDTSPVSSKGTKDVSTGLPQKLAAAPKPSSASLDKAKATPTDARKERASLPTTSVGKKASSAMAPNSISKHGLSDGSQSSASMKRTISHQRNTSSPIKPSPLGSSPPTNASDFDHNPPSLNTSSSSSSPLISQTRKDTNPVTHKPALAHQVGQPVQNTSEHTLKRKAGDLDSDIHNHDAPVTNGDKHPAKRHQASAISTPTPDSSSSCTPSFSRQTIEMAQKFKTYYAKYERLYSELSSFPDPPQDKVDQVLKMHDRLTAMKAEITNKVVS